MVNYMINWKSPREKRFSPCTAFFSYLSRRLSIWLADAHLPKHFSANEEKETKRKIATTHNSQLNKWLLAYRNKRKKKCYIGFTIFIFRIFESYVLFISLKRGQVHRFSSHLQLQLQSTLLWLMNAYCNKRAESPRDRFCISTLKIRISGANHTNFSFSTRNKKNEIVWIYDEYWLTPAAVLYFHTLLTRSSRNQTIFSVFLHHSIEFFTISREKTKFRTYLWSAPSVRICRVDVITK